MNYYIGAIECSSELYHHGIKGQKWGVRRFQNEDGSLTSAGRSRYGGNDGNSNGSIKGKIAKKLSKKVAKTKEKIKTAYNKAKESYKKGLEEYEKEEEEKAPIKEKLEERLNARLENNEISEDEYDKLMDDADDMSADELKKLHKEIVRQERSERAKQYLSQYQFKKDSETKISDLDDDDFDFDKVFESKEDDFNFDDFYESERINLNFAGRGTTRGKKRN